MFTFPSDTLPTAKVKGCRSGLRPVVDLNRSIVQVVRRLFDAIFRDAVGRHVASKVGYRSVG